MGGERPTPSRRGVEEISLGGDVSIMSIDSPGHESDVALLWKNVFPRRHDPVEPARVDITLNHLRPLQQIKEKRLVGRAARDQHGRFGKSPAKACNRFASILAPAQDLDDYRVIFRSAHVALS